MNRESPVVLGPARALSPSDRFRSKVRQRRIFQMALAPGRPLIFLLASKCTGILARSLLRQSTYFVDVQDSRLFGCLVAFRSSCSSAEPRNVASCQTRSRTTLHDVFVPLCTLSWPFISSAWFAMAKYSNGTKNGWHLDSVPRRTGLRGVGPVPLLHGVPSPKAFEPRSRRSEQRDRVVTPCQQHEILSSLTHGASGAGHLGEMTDGRHARIGEGPDRAVQYVRVVRARLSTRR